MVLLDFGAIPTDKVNFDLKVHFVAGAKRMGHCDAVWRRLAEGRAAAAPRAPSVCASKSAFGINFFPPFLLVVIKFLEVYERSFCRTIETLVDIFQEYPDEVEYIFKPSCVPLMRCAGCCGDEGLECVPVDVYNVTMEIMRIKPHQSQHIAHMSFLQHSKCDCRPKKDVKNKQEKWAQKPRSDGPSFIPQTWSLHDPQPWQSFLMLYPESGKSRRVCPTRMDSSHCEPCSERRKHLFVQDPQTCKCSCKFTDSRCKSRQLELNERTCRCEKPRR
nr:PREDICTED: vascular endothelial growth factor A [Struthio camelus australis]